MMGAMSQACPLCGGDAAVAFETPDRNRRIGDETFTYRRCASCGTLFLENVPDDLGRYYPSDYYVLPSLDELRAAAAAGESYRLDLVTRWKSGGRLVEVGPGTGIFAI